jgi:hypothetical protein
MNQVARIVTVGIGCKRSWKRESLWMAGTAAVGTLIGALTGGKRGAAIGATASGATRFILALAKR